MSKAIEKRLLALEEELLHQKQRIQTREEYMQEIQRELIDTYMGSAVLEDPSSKSVDIEQQDSETTPTLTAEQKKYLELEAKIREDEKLAKLAQHQWNQPRTIPETSEENI